MPDLTAEAKEAAVKLRPWSTSLPWWVVLIEGAVLAIVGLLTLLDPSRANINIALLLSAGLAVAGLLDLWDVMRSRAPENVDSAAAARAGIAVFGGLVILILSFMGELTVRGGLVIFGLASLVFGLLGIILVVAASGAQRRKALVETVLFTGLGLLMIYTLFSGPAAVQQAVTMAGWLALIIGGILIAMAIWRWQKGTEADQMIDSVVGTVDSGAAKATATITSVEDPFSPTASKPQDIVDPPQ